MLDCPPFASAPNATLDFIGDKENAMPVANPPQFLREGRWRRDISTFPLHRFHEDRRHFLRRQPGLEQFVFDEASPSQRVLLAFAINVWKRNVCDAGYQRSKP